MAFESLKSYFRKITPEPEAQIERAGNPDSDYINAQIDGARTRDSDSGTYYIVARTNKSREQLAREQAELGWPANTASHLAQTGLPDSEKGAILARAYEEFGVKSDVWAKNATSFGEREGYLNDAKISRNIAQGLKRAAKKLQKS